MALLPDMVRMLVRPDGSSFDIHSESVVNLGRTGVILRHGEGVLKIPKLIEVNALSSAGAYHVENMNEMSLMAFEDEVEVYKRMGAHEGLIECFGVSAQGIELAFAAQGDLHSYIIAKPEQSEAMKAAWIFSLAKTVSYIHSRKVLIDDLVLANILVAEDQSLKLADFGQSHLLPLTAELDMTCQEGVTVKVDIFRLGWVFYSIAVWSVHDSSLCKDGEVCWPEPDNLPATSHLACGKVIQNCWTGQYSRMETLIMELQALGTRDIARVTRLQ